MVKRLERGWYVNEIVGVSIVNPRCHGKIYDNNSFIHQQNPIDDDVLGSRYFLEQNPNDALDLGNDDFDWEE